MERKKLPLAYSTQELGKTFLEAVSGDDYEEQTNIIRSSLAEILQEKFPGKSKKFLIAERNEFIKLITKEGYAFEFLAVMLQDNHPMLKGWPEKEKRSDLYYILGERILRHETLIFKLDIGIPVPPGTTREALGKDMAPYINFRNKLNERAGPTPANMRK